MQFTVAIDGPAASGKGTIGRAVAERFGFAHLDTGLLYRSVGRKVRKFTDGAVDPLIAANLAAHLTRADLAADDLRSAEIGQAASQVAAIPEVRAALMKYQQAFARREGGAVLDGRDIGTVICPDAEVKLYVTASDEERARRRWLELQKSGAAVNFEDVLADLRRRDARDAARNLAPMKPAEDAHLLDTTELSIDAAVAEAVALIKRKLGQGRD
ncbi:MAG: (d)CMP kinase [Paracoccaceae bacterium]